MENRFLSVVTIGQNPARDQIIELVILDNDGRAILDTLVNPQAIIPGAAIARHGITNGMVSLSPTLDDLWPEIYAHLKGSRVIVADATTTRRLFPDELDCAGEVICLREIFLENLQTARGSLRALRHNWLEHALTCASHTIDRDSHRTLATANAIRAIWNWLNTVARLHTAA